MNTIYVPPHTNNEQVKEGEMNLKELREDADKKRTERNLARTKVIHAEDDVLALERLLKKAREDYEKLNAACDKAEVLSDKSQAAFFEAQDKARRRYDKAVGAY